MAMLALLVSACERPLEIYRPALRYALPEVKGSRTVNWKLQSNSGHHITFDHTNGYYDFEDVSYTHFYSEPQFLFTYSPIDKFDFTVTTGRVGFGGEAKYQFVGQDQAHAGAGNIAMAVGASLIYREVYSYGTDENTIGLQIKSYFSDLVFSAGYRVSRDNLLYGTVFYAVDHYSGRLDNERYYFNEPTSGIGFGLATFPTQNTSVLLEAVRSRFSWHGRDWDNNSLGLRFEKDMRL